MTNNNPLSVFLEGSKVIARYCGREYDYVDSKYLVSNSGSDKPALHHVGRGHSPVVFSHDFQITGSDNGTEIKYLRITYQIGRDRFTNMPKSVLISALGFEGNPNDGNRKNERKLYAIPFSEIDISTEAEECLEKLLADNPKAI